jgi:hypothetical protein
MNERTGFALIPRGAWMIAGILCLACAVLTAAMTHALPETFVGFLFGLMLGGTALLAGYIYGDAPRRGMPRVPWTLLAILAPNGIGFLVYFLMRNPVQPHGAR